LTACSDPVISFEAIASKRLLSPMSPAAIITLQIGEYLLYRGFNSTHQSEPAAILLHVEHQL
jgi:hypothetical protein